MGLLVSSLPELMNTNVPGTLFEKILKSSEAYTGHGP